MRVVAISCVKNELDIVEAFVRHTLAHADRLVVLDNGSTDGTRQILRQLEGDGLALDVVDDPTPGHYQWSRMTVLMRDRAAGHHGADWVLPVDADEFVTGPELKSLLATDAAPDRPFALQWKTYVPDPTDDPAEPNPVRRIRHRLTREARPCVKVVVPAALARRTDVILDQGSHQVIGPDGPVTPVFGSAGHLAHFPGRSVDQFALKVAVKHVQYLAMTARQPDWGHHYKIPVELLRHGPRRFAAGFRDLILRYNLRDDEPFTSDLTEDPLPYAGGPLRFTPADADSNAVAALLGCAEEFARRHAATAVRLEELEQAVRRLDAEVRQRDATIQDLRATNQALRRSWTWRAGRVALSPARWAKRFARLVPRHADSPHAAQPGG
jgi:glycosyltransferase involved in cell wall biosynthesis